MFSDMIFLGYILGCAEYLYIAYGRKYENLRYTIFKRRFGVMV